MPVFQKIYKYFLLYVPCKPMLKTTDWKNPNIEEWHHKKVTQTMASLRNLLTLGTFIPKIAMHADVIIMRSGQTPKPHVYTWASPILIPEPRHISSSFCTLFYSVCYSVSYSVSFVVFYSVFYSVSIRVFVSICFIIFCTLCTAFSSASPSSFSAPFATAFSRAFSTTAFSAATLSSMLRIRVHFQLLLLQWYAMYEFDLLPRDVEANVFLIVAGAPVNAWIQFDLFNGCMRSNLVLQLF